uniref:Uncharacterized protein n=1 Tax=Serinus canaria TaxID=9135 RepID=A0A8C9KSV7_SERCA
MARRDPGGAQGGGEGPGRVLEALKVVEKDQDGGRKLTPQGQRDLDRIAGQVSPAWAFPELSPKFG